VCSTIYTVPGEIEPLAAPGEPLDGWHLKTPEGHVYGRVSREVLDQWVAEGRVSDDCQIMQESEGNWQSASVIYPVLRPVVRGATLPAAHQQAVNDTIPSSAPQPAQRILNNHRGGMILALGIISWAIGCPIFGLMAWIMGNSDLREMERGAMDPQGMGLTQAGQIVGMIHVIIALFAIVIGLVGVIVLGMIR
jgi:hypothetical protein